MIFRGLFSLFFILILSLTVLIDTNIGLVFLIKAAPGEATATQVSGTLLHGGTIKNFNYQYDDFSISFDELNFHWQWQALLKQNLVIDEIYIKNIKVNLSQSSSRNSNLHLPSIHLPINIYLKQVLIENINIHKNKNAYLINTARLSGEVINDFITLHQFSIITPDFSTTSQGKINIKTWSTMNFKNTLILSSRPEIPVFTTISGDNVILALKITSAKWLNINFTLQNYLQGGDNIILKSNWFVDTTKANFSELKKINGKLQFSGHAHGHLLHPLIDGILLAKNLHHETTSIKKLNSSFSFGLDDQQKVSVLLSGFNISFGKILLNSVQASIDGTLKSHRIRTELQMLDSYFFSFSTQGGVINQDYYFTQGKFNAEPLNLILSPISLNIHFGNDKNLSYKAKIQHHNETLIAQGNGKLVFPNFEAYTSLSSNKFTIIDTDTYKITVNQNLFLNYKNDETKITGTLNVISANISPVDFSNTVTLTNDIVYVNNQNQPLYKKSEPLQVFMDIIVKIKRLAINYKGINAVISGETKLTQTPSTELNAYGQLQILTGSYKAYGQMLTIQKDSILNFNREIDNPQLNITASKEIKISPEYMTLPSYQPYLIAGVQVTGTANEPNIHLFSIPSGVSQQDILSYLIFGFPQNQLSKAQTSTLWSAFNMIDTGNSNFSLIALQKNIQNEFGFSEFGIGSTSEYNAATQQYESGTAFVVGKRITDNLTATYNVGLLVPVNVLYLRYRLSQHWVLQSDSSALGNGGDILYTIHRD